MHHGPTPVARSAQAPNRRPVLALRRSTAVAALRQRFAALRPELEVSSAGHLQRIEDNLLPGVEPRHFAEDLESGDGRELESKFLAVHSSAALAVNTFARFKDGPEHLALAGLTGFRSLAFEFRCPIGLRGGRPAHLDLVAQGANGVVAVESKCTEHLQPKAPSFSPRYAGQIQDERRAGVWFRAMEAVLAGAETFQLLDVAQLIKHAFGLARCFKGRPTTLLYLYWEPLDAARQPTMLAHRREIERFARLVTGGSPAFCAQSHADLWDAWQQAARPAWLEDHVSNLRARYGIALDGDAQIPDQKGRS